MIGPIPPLAKIFGYALFAIPVFLSSLGGAWLITLVAPRLFDGFPNEFLKFKPEGAVQMLLTFGIFVVVAPVLEEFTFRGLLFTRLSVKYSSRTAIILSSLMFGLMHIDFIGAFVFGLVAASLYSRSRIHARSRFTA
jgi:membrane protease YdiL (CAAX protease family)